MASKSKIKQIPNISCLWMAFVCLELCVHNIVSVGAARGDYNVPLQMSKLMSRGLT